MEGKYLITTDNWFYAPDGKQYKCAWGEVEIFKDDILGIDTNRHSTDWYAKIGNDHNHIIVAGCQIHYAVKCSKKPTTDLLIEDYTEKDGKISFYNRPNTIYIAE